MALGLADFKAEEIVLEADDVCFVYPEYSFGIGSVIIYRPRDDEGKEEGRSDGQDFKIGTITPPTIYEKHGPSG